MWFHCKDVSWGGVCGVGGHADQISVISLETRAAPREGRGGALVVGVGSGRISPFGAAAGRMRLHRLHPQRRSE